MSSQPPAPPATRRSLILRVNGRESRHTIPAHLTLAELIRDELGLTGTKIACNEAACGACTVLLDGRPVFACHTLAAQAAGCRIETIESLVEGEAVHPLQAAFVAHDALQCGFCTPGMIMALKGVIEAGVPGTREALAAAISGNVCRCGAYQHILDAALAVVTT